jgi:RNase H-fold protein (predicted Holliday junction resolvase)
MSMNVAEKLIRVLKAPAKVASALDWKIASGAILAMDIGSGKISLALSSHPSYREPPRELKSIPIKLETRKGNKRALSRDAVAELQEIVKKYNVAGFLVNWPVQPEGRCGAPCGKTLHTLEAILDESSTIINQNRGFCLWDEHHFVDHTDEWGRNKVYGEVPPAEKTLHIASQEQYKHETSGSTAVKVWNDFCRRQWPELYQTSESSEQEEAFTPLQAVEEDEDAMVHFPDNNYEDTSTYVAVSI